MSITILSKYIKEAQEKGENEFFSILTSSLDPIVDEVITDIEGLSCHPYGCRVIQRLVENCTGPHRTKILNSIISRHKSLLDDQYGNYVIQRVLSYGRSSDKGAIFDTITGVDNIFRLSKRKQASNVVEMMIKHGNAPQRRKIIQEMLDSTCIDRNGNAKSAVVSMAVDAYANYVVKTALDVIEYGQQRDQLFRILTSNLELLEDSPFAKCIVTRITPNEQDPRKN